MNIYDDVNTTATYKNVDKFLKNKLPRLVRLCGRSLTDLSSPQLSLTPVKTSLTNSQESKLVNSFGISKIVEAVYQSIIHCSPISKKILMYSYIKYIPQLQLIASLPYEHTQYYAYIKPEALNEFADLYNYYQKYCEVDKEDLIDLHVYK
jgi:ArpU family phage transcriptional regulator